jgi:hypothetical protein
METLPVPVVNEPETLREQGRHWLPDHFFPLILKDRLGLRIGPDDVSVPINDHDGVRSVLKEALEHRRRLLDLLFLVLSFGHISYDGQHGFGSACTEGAEHDIDGEFRSVLSTSEQVEAGSHLPQAGAIEIVGAVALVCVMEALRYEHLHRLAHNLVPGIPKEEDRLFVGELHPAIRPHYQDTVGRGLEDRSEKVLFACS